jgi:hypothetical protein
MALSESEKGTCMPHGIASPCVLKWHNVSKHIGRLSEPTLATEHDSVEQLHRLKQGDQEHDLHGDLPHQIPTA